MAGAHGLTFGPDPSTHDHCAIGGMIGNNACGAHAQMAGRTAENVEELEVLTYDGLRMRVGPTSQEELERIVAAGGRRGEIYQGLRRLRDRYADEVRRRFPKIPRRVSGYCLEELLPENGFNVARALVGSESTCALVLEATCRLLPRPKAKALVVLGWPDVYQAADHVPDVLEHEGCLHTRINFDLETAGGIRRWRAFLDDAADLVVGYGGSFSGEHGDGQSRAELLPKLYGPRAGAGVRRVQGDLGSGQQDEPR